MKQKLFLCVLIVISLFLTACSQSNDQQAEKSTISQEEAKDIALAHAGVTREQASFIKSHMDIDDGKSVYDVEFYTPDGREYDYEIDPGSGNILDFDLDVENFMN